MTANTYCEIIFKNKTPDALAKNILDTCNQKRIEEVDPNDTWGDGKYIMVPRELLRGICFEGEHQKVQDMVRSAKTAGGEVGVKLCPPPNGTNGEPLFRDVADARKPKKRLWNAPSVSLRWVGLGGAGAGLAVWYLRNRGGWGSGGHSGHTPTTSPKTRAADSSTIDRIAAKTVTEVTAGAALLYLGWKALRATALGAAFTPAVGLASFAAP
ncbi:MAG: hypothetical protein HY465_01180 [Deltaproteobacteria bacterium]|nr:hypothetical protein [Deltaproteobacteria bacterium]